MGEPLVPFNTETERMHGVATEIDREADNIHSQLMALHSYCKTLEGPWLGPASIAFQELMVRFNNNATQLKTVLEASAVKIHKEADDYEATEHANAAMSAGMVDSLPAVNL